MTVIARPRNNYGFLFGTGADGNVTISANTNIASTLNGNIIYRNYMNLTINSGCTLSVLNPCKGLWIRVRGTLTLNGAISMSNKGCYIAGGGDDLYLCYNDILVPKVGAAGGAGISKSRTNGSAGTDGKSGGGGSGGYAGSFHKGGDGAVGACGCGGAGGGGATYAQSNDPDYPGYTGLDGFSASPYGQAGGNGRYSQWNSRDCYGVGGGGAGGVTPGLRGDPAIGENPPTNGGTGAGGLLIIMANRIAGSGQFLSKGANGGNGWSRNSNAGGGGGGGSGGGSITLFYSLMTGTPTFSAAGGLGGAANVYQQSNWGSVGGAGGAGSCRDYSLAELASHTRV